MRIVFLSPWFADNLGYIENALPKALASLGADVHVVTSGLQPGFDSPNYGKIFEPFMGSARQPLGSAITNGFTVHRLPHRAVGGRPSLITLVGLFDLLQRLMPDVVQTGAAASLLSLQAAVAKPVLMYRLFTGAHQCASTFALATSGERLRLGTLLKSHLLRFAPGRVVSLFTDVCYAVTPDAAVIATKYYGVQDRKVRVCPLGADPELFRPASGKAYESTRLAMRKGLGIDPHTTLCVYTGRLTAGKNPLLLAKAIAKLRSHGRDFMALFVGGGLEAEAITALDGNLIQPYVPWAELAEIYRAADIAVWPALESSSQSDALSCGIPLVISDTIQKPELLEAGALTYRTGDLDSLIEVLLSLERVEARAAVVNGARDGIASLSWERIAEARLRDYQAAAAIPKQEVRISASQYLDI